LAEHGVDQFPGGSNCSYPDNFGLLTDFCKKTINEDHLYGMMMTTWLQVTEEWREQLFAAADIVKETFKD
ncbi:MAG: hypothetical protein J6Q69_02590, partial [Clostridia bacterium]|nr:hypothetical protein [Clostridia bacterium]